jgi:hypothetical protein
MGSFKIQKYGTFRNSLVISNRMVYKMFDFDLILAKCCSYYFSENERTNLNSYFAAKIFQNFFDVIFRNFNPTHLSRNRNRNKFYDSIRSK